MNPTKKLSVLYDDTMDDCSASDSSTEELDEETSVLQNIPTLPSKFPQSFGEERRRVPPFTMGQTSTLVKAPFARHHEDTRRNRTIRKKFTHHSFDRITKQIKPNSTDIPPSSSFSSIFNDLPVPLENVNSSGTRQLRARTSDPDDFCALQPLPTPPSPYKPPNEKVFRSRSVTMVSTDRPKCDTVLVPPCLSALDAKENLTNSPASSSTPNLLKRLKISRSPMGIRRTKSDMGSPTSKFTTGHTPKLPYVRKNVCDFISVHTVYDLLNGKYDHFYDNILIVDCRYTYEYEGGHIPGAISILPAEREELLRKHFFSPAESSERTAIVFHCEFSSKRGPDTWRRLRDLDRNSRGIEQYDELYYPEIYVMDGGYQNFYQAYPDFCEGRYIEMKDKRFKGELAQNIKREKQNLRHSSNSFVAPASRTLSARQTSLSFSSHI